MLAGFECADRIARVRVVAREYDDGVDCGVLQDGIRVRRCLLEPELLRGDRGARALSARDSVGLPNRNA